MATTFALLATAVSGVFAVTLILRYVRRGRTSRPLLYWSISLGMFCVASAMLVLGVLFGWNSAVFRTFYLFGATLNVPWLALGSVAVNAQNRTVTRATGGLTLAAGLLFVWGLAGDAPLLFAPGAVMGILWGLLQLGADRDGLHAGSVALLGIFSVVAGFAVLSAAFTAELPSTGLPEGAELFPELVRGFAIGGNAIGAAIVVLGAIVSVIHLGWGISDNQVHEDFRRTSRRAPVEAVAGFTYRASRAVREARLSHLASGNLMVALGVLVAAAGGAFSFLGETAGHAVGLGIGVTIMYLGFVRTTRPVKETSWR